MRVTNSMMRNNSLMNMQKNKNVYNKYLQEYSSQKKIQRPSDDPTIAVRALKYRTTLADIEQFLKNIDDATSWMNQTETSLKDVSSILTTMQDYYTQAATGTYGSSDREKIITQLKEYQKYIYEQDANADYRGRYLFTGYRTDLSLLFEKDQEHTTYTITEKLDVADIRKYQYVYGGAEYDATKTADDYATESAEFRATHRIMISYDNCDDVVPTITYKDSTGADQTITPVVKSVSDDTVFNEHLKPDGDQVFFVPETGEVIFGDDIYETVRNGSDLQVEYQKTSFKTNEIRPEHYFNCVAYNIETGESINYRNPEKQEMSYQINFSQTLSVNTIGCNAIDTTIRRKIDEITDICNDIDNIEQELKSVEKRLQDCPADDEEKLSALNELKTQIETKLTLEKTVLTNQLGSGITVCQDAQSKVNVALANHGSRYNRMEMTKSKLKDQELATEEAKSDNEDADLGEAYIGFSEADLLYQATLNATNKILGQSLLNFI